MTDTDMKSSNISVSSTKAAQSLKITWTVPDYSSIPELPNYLVQSPSFVFANATWCFQFRPNGHPTLSLVRLDSLISWHEIIYIVSANEEYCQKIYKKSSYEENCERFFYSFLPRRSQVCYKKNILTADGNLTLSYHLLYHETKEEDAFPQKQRMLHIQDCFEMDRKIDEQNFGTISLKSSIAHSIKIMWKISNYFALPDASDYSLTSSPSFNFADAIWFLKLYPNKTVSGTFPATYFSLVRSCSLVPLQEIIYLFDIVVKDDIYNRGCYSKLAFNEDCELLAPFSILPKRACMLQNSQIFAPEENVTLLFEFFCAEATERDADIRKMKCELDSCRILCEDMRNSLLNGQDHDLTLKVKNKEFRVHQNMLRARSQVCRSMLTHDMIEKNGGVVNIPDCDPQTMEQFLLYMYGNKVDVLNENNMLALYNVANEYKMIPLKEQCHDFIQNSLTCSNICDIVQLALNHSDKSLLECTTDFFINHSSKILTTAEWKSFRKENKIAAEELLSKTSKNVKN